MSEQHQEPEDPRKLTVSYTTTRNLGNFEKAELSVYLSGIKPDTTGAEIDAMIAQAEITFDKLREAVNAKIDAEKERVAGKPIPPRPQQPVWDRDSEPKQPGRVNPRPVRPSHGRDGW
jgi:hypothetical protein